MHTGVLIAVEAEDLKDAIEQANTFADGCDWSDWSEQGGRFAEPDKSIVRYSDNPELFQNLVDKFKASTEDEIREVLDHVGHLTISELVINPRYRLFADEEEDVPSIKTTPRDSMEVFSVFGAAKILRMIAGYFTPETHFWDITWATRSAKYMKERIAENPDKQYVIVWDFHH